MRSALFKSTLAASLFLFGAAAQKQAGMAPEWDVRAILKEISAHAQRLLPVLAKVDAQAWVAKGASETYVSQLNSCKAQAKALSADALELAGNPERLPEALKAYFRMQALEFMLFSLDKGIRQYQGPAVADELLSLQAENGANRERLQHYIIELSTDREEQFRVMDHEAQRCRGFLASQPASALKGGRKQ